MEQKFLKYPPMPWRYDRRRKIKSQKMIDRIISLYDKSGWSVSRIAKKYKVTVETILRYVNQNYREYVLETNRTNSAKFRQENPEKHAEGARKSYEYKMSIMPKIKRYYTRGLSQSA